MIVVVKLIKMLQLDYNQSVNRDDPLSLFKEKFYQFYVDKIPGKNELVLRMISVLV